MPVVLTIKHATAYLYPNDDHTRLREQFSAGQLSPEEKAALEVKLKNTAALRGRMEATIDGDGARKLNLDVAVWIRDKDGEPYYSGNAGGIPLTLFKFKQKRADNDPDYTGSFGVDRDTRMRNAAWKQFDGHDRPYISIEITERVPQNRASEVREGDVPTSLPARPQQPPAASDQESVSDDAPKFV